MREVSGMYQWVRLQRTIFQLVGALLLGACVVACERGEQDAESDAPVASAPPQPYVAPDAGLIKNPSFSKVGEKIASWSTLQHAGEASFAFAAEGGVLTISRTGAQPWGMVRQRLSRDDTKPLQGKTLEFSAELSASLTGEFGAALDPTGLRVMVKGVKRGAPAMLGTAILATSEQAIAGTEGEIPWQRYALRFKVPADTEASHVFVELGIMLASGGSLSVRGPVLQEVATSDTANEIQ
ncbi:hypothetical protein [uncultured Gilvimarinus sp.]|uniref:hypothetical protein n=1 Tax=uncultured Gilvimarinus sp. TaxID=1689143 RepID=UPI0030EEFD00